MKGLTTRSVCCSNEVSDSQFDSDDDSYEAIPKPAKPYTTVAIPPAVQVASVRGILKKTVVPPMILDEELEEVTLYDHEPPLEPVSSRTKPGSVSSTAGSDYDP